MSGVTGPMGVDRVMALRQQSLERNQALVDQLAAGENGIAEKQLTAYLDDAEAQILGRYPVAP